MKRKFLLTSTLFVTTFCYLFALVAWISIQSFARLLERWSHNSEMTIYLKPEVNTEEIDKLKKILSKFSDQVTAAYQSPEDLKAYLKKIMPKSEYNFAESDELATAIPPHFIVKGSSSLLDQSIFDIFNTIGKELGKNPSVDSSSYGKSWAEKYATILESVKQGAFAFLLALGLALTLVIGNSIRAHIHSQREEIEILELVGATPTMIRKPFLIEGTFLAIVPMVAALSIATALIYFLRTLSGDFLNWIDLRTFIIPLTANEWLAALGLSAGVGLLGSHFCLNEINTGWAASGRSATSWRFQRSNPSTHR